MSTFNQTLFIQEIARRQSHRVGITLDQLAAAPDALQIEVSTSPAVWTWQTGRDEMTSEPWAIARMSADLRGMIEERQRHGAREAVTISMVDVLDLGWTHEQARAFLAVAMANAHASLRAEAAGLTQRQFSGFGSTACLAAITVISGAIGLTATAIATLL